MIGKIEEAVGLAKKSDEWRRNFMMYQERQRTAEIRGEIRGRMEAQVETVKRPLEKKMPMAFVRDITGLSPEEILEIEKNSTNE